VLANDAAGAHAELNNRAAQLAQAQQALAEETQRLAQTTQLVQELRHRWAALSHTLALAETDAQGLVVEANQSFWQLVGLGGQKPLNLKDHLQATGLAPGLGEALTHGKPWQGEWQVQTHTGQTRTLAGVAIPLGPDPAEAHPVLLALWDTTALHATLAEAKQALSTVHAQLSQRESELAIAQAELAQSRQWADQLASTLGVVQLDAAGNALMANSQASAMLAISASEWVGQPIESLLRIADANSPAQWLSHLASESPWSCRLRPAAQPHHPGALCSVMAHTPALGASVYTCLFVAPPQSEHASAEANQTESAWLRNISQTVYVAHASTEGVLQSINPAFASALGYAADELVGKPLEGLLKAEEAVGAARELRNALAATMLWRMELPLATQQGHTLWVQLAFSTLPGQEGQGRLLVGHNISQAKLMEAKVEELSVAYERTQSEATERTEQLQNMFANVPGIIYQRDAKPGYPIRLLNDQILNLLGYPVEDFAPGGSRSFTDLIHPDDLPRVVNELEHSLNRYEPYRIIYRVRNRVQAIRWVQDEGRGVFDSNGHLLHCDGVIFDISQQKTLESNLRQSSTLLKQQQMELAGQIKALNNAAIVSETDFKGIITYVNDEATHLWGYTRSELIGQKHSLLRSSYHSDTFYERMWEEISQGNVWQGEIVNRTKTDEELWCILTISPVLDINRKPFKYIAVAVDITRQKRQASRILDVLNEVKHHEQELMEQAQHLEEAQRELLDTHLELEARIQAINHSAIVSETDTNGFIRFVNEEACHIWGYERHELVGKPHSIINSGYHPEAFWTEMWDTLTRGNAWTGQVLNRAKDGREFWVQLSVTPVLDVQGKPTKFIGIAFDITPQRVQAERIRKALKESEQREENYRAELEALRSQASDALPHVGEMARALMLETPSPVLLAGANAELLAHNQAFESLTPEVGLHPHKVMQMPAARLGQKPRPLAEWLLMWPANAAEPSDLFLETPEGQAWAVLTVVPTREAYFGFRFALHAKPLADKLPDTPVWEAELAAHKTEVDRLRRELEQMENTLAEELRQLAQDYETTLSAQTAELAELRQRIAALN
jgi:PAS domain S-box-containing protein